MVLQNEPAGHVEHDVWALLPWKVPAAHAVQLIAPADEYWPEPQSEQPPEDEVNLPAEHDGPRAWQIQGSEAPQLMSFQLPLL